MSIGMGDPQGFAVAVASLSGSQVLRWLFEDGWFRAVYQDDGTLRLRARSARWNSGFIISSAASIGSVIAAPYESIKRTVDAAPFTAIAHYTSQDPSGSLTGAENWGPLAIAAYHSDSDVNPVPSAADRAAAQTFYFQDYVLLDPAPHSLADFDPLFVEIRQRRARHWLQWQLGLHDRVEFPIDSAVAATLELGSEIRVYLPEHGIVGAFQIVKVLIPLSLAPATVTARYVAAS